VTNHSRRHNPADMHNRKLDPRLYDDEWSDLERKARRDLILYYLLPVLAVWTVLALARYALA
jgi:hypothetical protein